MVCLKFKYIITSKGHNIVIYIFHYMKNVSTYEHAENNQIKKGLCRHTSNKRARSLRLKLCMSCQSMCAILDRTNLTQRLLFKVQMLFFFRLALNSTAQPILWIFSLTVLKIKQTFLINVKPDKQIKLSHKPVKINDNVYNLKHV